MELKLSEIRISTICTISVLKNNRKYVLIFPKTNSAWKELIDGLVQYCSNSIANALELLQSCTKPSQWYWHNAPSDSHAFCKESRLNGLIHQIEKLKVRMQERNFKHFRKEIYRQTSNISHTKSENFNVSHLVWPIQWSQVLSWEWRCSWSSADRRCSNYIWVIDNFIAY